MGYRNCYLLIDGSKPKTSRMDLSLLGSTYLILILYKYLDYVFRYPRSLKITGIYAMIPTALQNYISNCDGSQKKDVLQILPEPTDLTGFKSAVQTVEQGIHYETHDSDSLKSMHSRLFSDIPQLPPLVTVEMIPALDQMLIHLEK